MDIKAHAKFVRISPRKVRLVTNLVSGMKVPHALVQLQMTSKRSAPVIEKLIRSAMANARHNFKVDPDTLVISEAFVNQGPTMKRWRPRAMGRAAKIRKRTSHISIILSDMKVDIDPGTKVIETTKEEKPKVDAKKLEKPEASKPKKAPEAKVVNEAKS